MSLKNRMQAHSVFELKQVIKCCNHISEIRTFFENTSISPQKQNFEQIMPCKKMEN